MTRTLENLHCVLSYNVCGLYSKYIVLILFNNHKTQALFCRLKHLSFLCICSYLDEVPLRSGKVRVILADHQKLILMEIYAKESHPSKETIRKLSEVIGLSELKVEYWFCNQRRKDREKKSNLHVLICVPT